MLNTAALSWAATRSGLSFGAFLSTLTPEREAEILDEYNAWRQSKGLAPVAAAPRPQIEKPRPAPAPAEPDDEDEEEIDEDEDDVDEGEVSASGDDWASEAEREGFEDYDDSWDGASEAEELLEEMPFELPDEELVAPETVEAEADDEPDDAEPVVEAAEPEPAPVVKKVVIPSGDLQTLLAKLPKEAEEAYYRAVRDAADTEAALREAIHARIEARRKSRKGTGPLKALLSWLDGAGAEK